MFDDESLNIIKKNYPNQIRNQGMKHFHSEGQIYSIGYATKYEKMDESQQSFSKYVNSKFYLKRVTILFPFVNIA